VQPVQDLLDKLVQIVMLLIDILADLGRFGLHWLLLIVWLAWWLWGANWQRIWPVLARGAWLPAVLLIVVAALVWSQISPSDCSCLGFVTVRNFWWQLGAVGLLAAATLFCGWLQGYFGWTPAEMELEPAAPANHGQGHGHHHH
jgi:hypothetical protein